MAFQNRLNPSSVLLSLTMLTVLSTGVAQAQVAKQGRDTLSSLAFLSDRLVPSEPVEPLEEVESAIAPTTRSAWESFRLAAPVEWRAVVDKRHGLIAFAEGGNIAWIPGLGNALTQADIASFVRPGAKAVDLSVLERIARGYLPKVAGMMGVDPGALVLNAGRSGQPASHVWFIDFDLVRGGMVIEGARVVFRVNNGNLIQFGSENLPVPGAVVPPTRLTREQALAAVAQSIGGFSSADSFLDNGSLHLLPANKASTGSADGFAFGNGRELSKVWEFTFYREGVVGTWRARVDAASGEVLELADVNDYALALVSGGIYQNSPTTGSEIVRPMPFANAAGVFANSAGNYSFSSATSSTLAGKYVKITDTCGAISQASDSLGNIAFGTSTGTDCTTPGHGGAGNTHASRQQFYQVNRIKEVGRGWLPANAWLTQQLGVNVNLNHTCNAYWNGSTLNFFKSGGGCNNTGEIAGVSLHEYGHGLDQNDGSGSESGTGESYADVTAAIALHNSCMGPGFRGTNCSGYGDACTACTGVRDIDFAKHTSNTPATVANFTQSRCTTAGSGPCGKEVHCESYVSSEAIWDFANRDLPGAGTGAAWAILDRLWYLSRSTSTKAFTCTSTSTPFTSNGCNTGSWWKTMRAVDDDDGNLSNGTPHGGALFAAFNRHGIACTTDTGASTTFSGCAKPAKPTLTATPGDNSISLSWTTSGSAVYDVFRNETGCNAGFTKISSGASGTSLTDTNVANGFTYYYQMTAFPTGNEACASAPSTCISMIPGFCSFTDKQACNQSCNQACGGCKGTGGVCTLNDGCVCNDCICP
jgi:trimeric autotransporter adhesin